MVSDRWHRQSEGVAPSRRTRETSGDELERRIVEMLRSRAATSTICPSDVARAVDDDWRPLMQSVRDAAARLVERGRVEVTQGGEVVDVTTAHGPVRIRLVRELDR